jgi:hypothetical protein
MRRFALICTLTIGLVVFASCLSAVEQHQQIVHDVHKNSQVDQSTLNLRKHKLARSSHADEPVAGRKHVKRNRNSYRHQPPQVGHRQQVYNSNQQNSQTQRSNQPHRRRSRVLNIADNWDKIPYILQTYK